MTEQQNVSRQINRVVIAGAGTMGSRMAQRFAACGYQVTLYNHREQTLRRAEERLGDAGRQIIFTTDQACFAACDLVVENIAEQLPVKQAFFETASGLVPETAILATNTSGLSINAIAAYIQRPERFIGMHWFNPPHLIPLIEIIRGDRTDDATAETIYAVGLSLDKKPVMVNRDIPGFAANRIQLAILRETLALVQDGVLTKEGADDVMKYGLGFRYACIGPLETVDFAGIDIFHHISEYLMADLCDSHETPALLEACYQKGAYGVKTGSGFYAYSGGRGEEAVRARDARLEKLYHALYESQDEPDSSK